MTGSQAQQLIIIGYVMLGFIAYIAGKISTL